jgi:hypothetical protein
MKERRVTFIDRRFLVPLKYPIWSRYKLPTVAAQSVRSSQDCPCAPENSRRYRRAVDTYRIYDGTNENGIVGTVAPGLFAQVGRCWRMVYANPVGHGTHCVRPVEWVGRWKFLKGWTKVWSCDRHANDLPFARRIEGRVPRSGVPVQAFRQTQQVAPRWPSKLPHPS